MASARIGIDGFGRMGRLALRAAFDCYANRLAEIARIVATTLPTAGT